MDTFSGLRSIGLFLSGFLISHSASGALNVYVSAPKSQTIDSTILSSATENFDSTTTTAVGTYVSTVSGVTYTQTTGTANFQPNDQYGGYLQSKYLGVAANSSVSITLATSQHYFGLYYTAADARNSVQIYNGSTLLLSFSTATLLSFLPNNATGSVTAIDNSIYLTKNYYGQPTSGRNAQEPYAYLSFIGTGTTTFDRIMLIQGNGSVFESDNHSFQMSEPAVPGSYVLIPASAIVPEPSTVALLALSAAWLGFWQKRRAVQPRS